MRVKCINERLSPELHNEKLVEWAKHSDLEISLNKTYVVLAISRYFDTIFFYILGDESNNYPLAFPSVLFEIIDIKYSIYWDNNTFIIKSLDELNLKNGEIISFKEWAIFKDAFYEKVLDEIEPEVSIFNNNRDKMLNEYI